MNNQWTNEHLYALYTKSGCESVRKELTALAEDLASPSVEVGRTPWCLEHNEGSES